MNGWLAYAIALGLVTLTSLAAARIAGRLGGRRARRPRGPGGGPARPSVDDLLARMDWAWKRQED